MFGHGILLVLTSISKGESGEDMVPVVLTLLPLQAWALERILPGRHTEALRDVRHTVPGTLTSLGDVGAEKRNVPRN